jgi:hypothetical protein
MTYILKETIRQAVFVMPGKCAKYLVSRPACRAAKVPRSIRAFTGRSLHPSGVPHPCQNRRKTAVTNSHPRAQRTVSDLDTRRLIPCMKRPVTKLLASPVTVWNRRRCLRLAQRGQCSSDKPVGDHGGSLACPIGVSSIRGSPVRGMKSSKQPVGPWPTCQGVAQSLAGNEWTSSSRAPHHGR